MAEIFKVANTFFKAVFSDKGLSQLDIRSKKTKTSEKTSEKLSPQTQFLKEELEEYFSGKKKQFETPLDLQVQSIFTQKVLEETKKLSFGHTTSYGELAKKVGSPGASRAVGTALGKNPIPILIPCHRVLGKNDLGGFSLGVGLKKELLKVEAKRSTHACA